MKLSGKWYNLDTTWDDSAASKYHYFLISDAKLAKNHQWNTSAFPKALKTYAAK